jgi:cohesin complex subunit SA-1/2
LNFISGDLFLFLTTSLNFSEKGRGESVRKASLAAKSTKKKRENDDDDDDDDPMLLSSGEEEGSDDDDYEQTAIKNNKSKSSPKSESAKKRKDPTQILLKESPQKKNQRTPSKLDHLWNATSVSPAENVPSKSAMAAAAKKIITDDDETPESSLMAALFYAKRRSKGGSESDVRHIARNVLGDILKDENSAHVSVLNLVFRSVGGSFKNLIKNDVNLDTLAEDALASMIQQIVEDMKQTPAGSILLCADPEGAFGSRTAGNQRSKATMKEYRYVFQQFWYELGSLIIESLSNDGSKNSDVDVVDRTSSLMSRLIELVWVGVPDIRAAIAMAIYQIAIALLEGTVQFQSRLIVANRQLQSAKRVSASSGSRKVVALEQQVKYLDETVASLEEIIKNDIMSVFLKRYRDNNEYIRAESLKALSSFSLVRPDIFLCSSYLKYFGWMLSDKNANVRISAIVGLLAPFRENKRIEQEEITINKSKMFEIEGMTGAIKKFLPRLADCIIDVDVGVQEVASELLLYLVQKDFFDDLDNDNIWYQINSRAIATDTSLVVRRNALYFIMEQLQPFDSSTADPDSTAVERIRALVQWTAHVLSDSDIPIEHMRFERTDLIILSLRSMPEHKHLACNWTAILRALKGDESNKNARMTRKSIGKGDQRSDAVQQRVILRWLVTSAESEVRSLASYGGAMMQDIDPSLIEIERKLNGTNKSTKNKDIDRLSTSHESLTCALLKALPELLISFKSEMQVMQSLTSLPRYLRKCVKCMLSPLTGIKRCANEIFIEF